MAWSLVSLSAQYVTGDAILRTEDCATFTPVTADTVMGYGVNMATDGAGTTLLLAEYGFFLSKDEGKTWAHSPAPGGQIFRHFYTGSQWICFCAGYPGLRVFTSPDALTWTSVAYVAPPTADYLGFAEVGMNGSMIVYIGLVQSWPTGKIQDDHYSTVSTDGGNTWTPFTLMRRHSTVPKVESIVGVLPMGTGMAAWFHVASGQYNDPTDRTEMMTTSDGLTWSAPVITNHRFQGNILKHGEQYVTLGEQALIVDPSTLYSNDGAFWQVASADPSDAVDQIRPRAGNEFWSYPGDNGQFVYAVRDHKPLFQGPSATTHFSDGNTLGVDYAFLQATQDYPLGGGNNWRANYNKQRLELMWRDVYPGAGTFNAAGLQTRNIERFDVTARLGADFGVYSHSIWYAAGNGPLATDEPFLVAGLDAGYRWDNTGHLRRWTGTGMFIEHNTSTSPNPYDGTGNDILRKRVGSWQTIGTFPPLANAGPNLLTAAQAAMTPSATDGWMLNPGQGGVSLAVDTLWWDGMEDGYAGAALHLFDVYQNQCSARTTGSFAVTEGAQYTIFVTARSSYTAAYEGIGGTPGIRWLNKPQAFLAFVNAGGVVQAGSTMITTYNQHNYINGVEDISGTVTVPTGLGIVGAYLVYSSNTATSFANALVYAGPMQSGSTVVRIKFDASTGVHEVFYNGVSQGTCSEVAPIKASGHDCVGVGLTRVTPNYDRGTGPYGSVSEYADQPNWIDDLTINEINPAWLVMRTEGGPATWEEVKNSTLDYDMFGVGVKTYATPVGDSIDWMNAYGGPSKIHFW